MRKQIAAFLIPSVILGVLLHDVVNTPFYSEAELRRVSEAAVKVARDGDTAEALTRFNALIDVAPKSPAVWADYFVILPWAGESAKALKLVETLPFPVEKLPAYTQRSLFETALRENRLAMAQRFAQNYIDSSADQRAALIDSVDLLLMQSQPAMALALLPRYEAKSPNDQAFQLRRVAAQLQLNNPQQIKLLPDLIAYAMNKPEERQILSRSLVNASRFRPDDRYLAALKTFYENEKTALFAADYLTVLVWHKHFDEAVSLFDQWQKQLPLYAQKAAMVTLAEVGRSEDAVQLFNKVNSRKALVDEDRIAVIRPLIAHGGADAALTLLNDETNPLYDDLRWQSLAALNRDEELLRSMGEGLQKKPADDDLSLRWLAVYKRLVINQKYSDIDSLVAVIKSASPRVQDEVIRDLIARNQLTDAQRIATAIDRENEFWLIVAQAAGEARQQKNTMHALDLYRYGVNSPINGVDSELGIVLTLRAQGRTLDAIAAMDNTLLRYPNNRVVADTAVDVYRTAGDNRRLLPLFEQTWRISNDKNYLRSWMGIVRSGNPYASLSQQRAAIYALQKRYPQDTYLKTQTVLIAVESGECIDQIDFPLKELSSLALEQLAFDMRRCEKMPLAIELYRFGQQKYPKNSVFPAGLILVDTQLKQFSDADKTYQSLSSTLRNSRDVQLARAVWLAEQQRYSEASTLYQQLAKRYPDNQQAFVGQVMNTHKAGNVEQAWVLADLHEQWFSAAELARLQVDRIAWTLRQALELSGEQRKSVLNRSMVQINSYGDFLQRSLPNDRTKFLALSWDRQLALNLSARHADVLSDYAATGVGTNETPIYALLTLADSQSALKQYSAAEQTLQQALQREPANPRVLRDLYYAYLSQDNYPAAEKTLLTMKSLTPDGPVEKATGQVYWAWRQEAMFVAYKNHLADAETMLKQFQQQAPDDLAVRQDLALIERWRGKPEAALHLYQQNLQQEPDWLDAKIGEVHALLEDRQHRLAGEKVLQLAAENETHPQVKELQRRWNVHNMREFDSRILIGQSSPEDHDPDFNPNNEYIWESYFMDEPQYDADWNADYRLYVRHIQSMATFDEPQNYRTLVNTSKAWVEKYDPKAAQIEETGKVPLYGYCRKGIEKTSENDDCKGFNNAQREIINKEFGGIPRVISEREAKWLMDNDRYGREINSIFNTEEDGHLQRIGIGRDLNLPEWSMRTRMEFSQSLIDESDKGLLLNSYWNPNDFWTFGGELQTWSSLVPLRALNAGSDGKSATFSTNYRQNESSRFDFSAGVVSIEGGTPPKSSGLYNTSISYDVGITQAYAEEESCKNNNGSYDNAFSSSSDFFVYKCITLSEQDNNVRKFVNLSTRQRIYADEIHVLDVIPAVYMSENSSQNVVYYSPVRDRAVTVSLDYEGLLWRDGPWRFKHHLNVGVGGYYQWNYVWWSDSINHSIKCENNYQAAYEEAYEEAYVKAYEETNVETNVEAYVKPKIDKVEKEFSACANNPPTRSGSDLIWDWQYEHLWSWSDTVRFNYGLLHRKRSYDGDLEDQDAVFGGVNVRF